MYWDDPTLNYIIQLTTFVGVIVTVVTLFYLLYQLKLSESMHRFEAYKTILEFGEEYRDARLKLEAMTPEQRNSVIIREPPVTKDEIEWYQLARRLDMLGILRLYGVVPVKLLMHFYSRPLITVWTSLNKSINEIRDKRGQRGHMNSFEMLAIEASNHRRIYHEDEKDNFIPTQEQSIRYEKWRNLHRTLRKEKETGSFWSLPKILKKEIGCLWSLSKILKKE